MNRSMAPYESDLEYLEEELEWIELRCKRIITGSLVDSQSDDGQEDLFYRQQHFGGHQPLDALTAKYKRLQETERETRDAVDRRLYATRESGFELALDKLVEMYALDDFERTILLLSAAVTFSRRFMQLFGRIWNGYEALVVETVFSFCELPFSERITHLKSLSKAGKLVENELVSLNMGGRINSPQELLEAQIRLSNRTFDFLVGDDHFMDEFLEFSSVEEPRARFDRVVLAERDKERILSVVERHDEYLRAPRVGLRRRNHVRQGRADALLRQARHRQDDDGARGRRARWACGCSTSISRRSSTIMTRSVSCPPSFAKPRCRTRSSSSMSAKHYFLHARKGIR